MINVIPVCNENYNCIESLIASLAAYWKEDYYMVSSNVWGFSYKTVDHSSKYGPLLGDRLSPNSGDCLELLEKYYNVKTRNYSIEDHYNAADLRKLIIDEVNQENPVILLMDIFHCPWTKFSKVYHSYHYCMAIGFNEDKTILYCIDPLYTAEVIELPISEFNSGCSACITLQRGEFKQITLKWRIVIEHAVSHFLFVSDTINVSEEMSNFVSEVQKYYKAEDEFKVVDDKRLSLLSTKINYLRLARFSFSNFLERFAKEFEIDEFMDYAKRMTQFGEAWFNINIMLIKSSYMPENQVIVNRITESIATLVEDENRFALDLQQFAKTYKGTGKNSMILKQQRVGQNKEELIEQRNDLKDNKKSKQVSAYKTAMNETEKKLVAIWKDVLEKDTVGTNDNFFDLGGDSLALVMMHNRLDALYPNQIDVADIFAYPTITKLAEYINRTNIEQGFTGKVKLLQLPESYFQGEVTGTSLTFSSELERKLYQQLNSIAQKRNVAVTSLFLAGYIYGLHRSTQQEKIHLAYVFDYQKVLPLDIGLDEIEELSDLIKMVDELIHSQQFVSKVTYDQSESDDTALILFQEKDFNFKPDNQKNKLTLSYAETSKGYEVKVTYANLNKEKVKELLINYIKIMNYITYNLSIDN